MTQDEINKKREDLRKASPKIYKALEVLVDAWPEGYRVSVIADFPKNRNMNICQTMDDRETIIEALSYCVIDEAESKK